ncbi:hypothetical protein J6590_097548 [Homalodisca vitripennis]|nr:hypothetical protein J6590_097546 [Homalodisca vitripennis]KAG8294686.1 hypothetical protein J6590_097548 [Homalodisca vitripennis]
MEAKTDVTTSSSYDCRISSSSYEFWKPRETSRPALAMIAASQVHPMNSGSQERPKRDVTIRISSSSYEFGKPRETTRPALAMIVAS